MLASEKTTKHLIITGRVQGVGFRQATHQKARQIGITGWVRNRKDGTVETMIQGDPPSIEAMIEWLRHGPMLAKVTHLEIEEADGEFEDFNFLETL